MKQILQNLADGSTELAEVPSPVVRPGALLIGTSRTLVSAGTERMLVDFGKAGWIAKARQQPDKVRMVLDKVRTDGLAPTIAAVRSKLDQPLAMGYCNAGVVLEAGEGVTGFAAGERVASNGWHAEVVCVPGNLCARIPESVSDDEAAFTVVGAIALQGIRLAAPTLGEAVVVTGLGLIGLIAVQLLRANGCRVLGIDRDASRLSLAREFGARTVDLSQGEDPLAAAQAFSRGRGVDAVIVTASTKSSEPMHQAAGMCRKRGRIVLVGVTGLELSRADFYEKELTFQVSCSYGPGRYDPVYEEQGRDYPVGFVRWTEQRNFEAVLDMMADGRIDVKPLVSHRFPIGEARLAYEVVGGAEPSLGILLEYPGVELNDALRRVRPLPAGATAAPLPGAPALGFVGAGSYATSMLMPAFREAGAQLRVVASATGVSATHAARKFGFGETTTDAAAVMADPAVDAVVIATRHDSHARYVLDAFAAGKHVFVEKPLALTLDELEAIGKAGGERMLMVGFNRRFAPLVQKVKSLLADALQPSAFVMTVNAGAIAAEHWTQDRAIGGGRLIGEGCHFVDLLRYLAGAPIERWSRTSMNGATADTFTLSLAFADGSLGTIHYLANGSRAFPKERLEVFNAGRVLVLDNFRRLAGHGWPGFSRMSTRRQDKGQRACAAAFCRALREGGPAPIPLDELLEVSRAVIEAAESDRA